MTDMKPASPTIATAHDVPRVSVVMPVYNTERYIAQAMESILSQTLTDLELLVVDDGSTDRSAEIALAIAARDSRVRVLRLPHAGITNVNRGVAEARAAYIARMDSDDLSEPTRLEKQAAFLEEHSACVAVGTWLVRTDPMGNLAGEQRPPTEHEQIDAAFLRCDGSAVTQGTTMFRREALLKVGGWRDTYGWIEDLDLYLRLGEVGELRNVPEFLYRYRRHPTSVCVRNYDAMRSALHAMLSEAYARRGLGRPQPIEVLRPDLKPGEGPASLYRNWACHAVHRGNRPVACRHALTALRLDPFSLQSWRVLYWSIAA